MEQNELKACLSKKNNQKKRRIVLWVILGILLLASIGAGIFIWHIIKRPDAFFETSVRVETTSVPKETPIFDIDAYLPKEEPETTSIPTNVPLTPTIRESDEMPEESNQNIVNVALFGIDAYENGKSTSGSMPHTDANIVLAINFETKEISMISIARDCLTTAPGYNGFYKFNGIFNVGGGMKDPKAGFELSCRAAEEWLGGISIPYYYGVDFQALIDLVDMIGGIDFDVDITLYTLDGQIIQKGRRHLDGQGVMAYMRMRKTAGGLDSNRTARQRKMLVAIFRKLQSEGKLSMVPNLLKTMGDNVYTNTSLAQTASLVSFAKEIDADSIKTYSIQGQIHMTYDWAFCFIDQQERLDILKTVYGIEAKPIGVNSRAYEKFLHQDGFKAILYLNLTKKIFASVHQTANADSMSEAQKTAYAQCWKDYTDLRDIFRLADEWVQAHYDGEASAEESERYQSYLAALGKQETKLRQSADALNEAFGKPIKARWDYNVKYWSDLGSDINEVYVDFR